MVKKQILVFTLALGAALSINVNTVTAQALMYMDESGNIHFEQSLKNVPERYRNQIVADKPAVDYKHRDYKNAARERSRMQKQLERQQRTAMKRTANKNERQVKKELKHAKRQLKKGQKLSAPLPGQSGGGMPTGADDAEFLE